MTLRYIRKPFTYASDGNYVDIGKPWDGQPRLILPSDAQLSAGATPDTPIAPELENGRFRIMSDAQAVQAHAVVQQFHRTDLNTGTTNLTKLATVQQTGGIGAPADRQKMILVAGATAGSLAAATLLNDGTFTGTVATLAGSTMNSAPASDSTGTIFVGISGGSVIKSTDGLATTSSVAVTGLTIDASWVGFTTSHYLVFEASTGKMFKATALGGAWTNATIAATTVHDICTNGAGTWVINCTNTTTQRTYYSTDDGVTWSLGASLGTASSSSGCYSDYLGLFVVITSAGLIYYSSDGITWTLNKTIAALSGVTFGQGRLASCGSAIACVVNRGINSINKYANGIAYTFDLGATWNEIYLGSPANVPVTSLISANGRFYATDGSSLFRSGVMIAPGALFTGV